MLNPYLISQLPKLNLSTNKYSQYGEEVVLQFIFKHIGTLKKPFFVEYGAGDGYTLSNTRIFKEQGWKGLMLDADPKAAKDVKREFITPDNIVSLLRKYKVHEKFDLLSNDMDSCDFWLLKNLLKKYRPRVIIAEYNSNLPKDSSLVLKYEPGYTWDKTSKYGFSFMAGKKLMAEWGYTLVHQHANTNMIFIADDILGGHLELNIPHDKVIVHPINPNVEWVEY